MNDEEIDEVLACPVTQTSAIIGGKWKPTILFHLSSGNKRYSELQKLIRDISDRMLTRTLKELEQDELVKRIVQTDENIKVEYALTNDGKSLFPILDAMALWGFERKNKKQQALD